MVEARSVNVKTTTTTTTVTGRVANPARGQLNREKLIFPCPRSCLRIWSRETVSAVPSRVSLLISILRLNLDYKALKKW